MRILIALTAASLLMLATPALAQSSFENGDTEFVIGVAGGVTSTDGETLWHLGVDSLTASESESGFAYGLTGQVNHKLDNDWFIGLHVGLSGNNTEFEESLTDGTDTASYTFSLNYQIDALATRWV